MKPKESLPRVAWLTLIVFLITACEAEDASLNDGPDYWPTEGWQTTTPETQGMDSEMLAAMFDAIVEHEHDIHSVTVVRNGYLVADAVIYPFAQDSRHNVHSVTKSIVSALIGIVIEQGHIADVNQPVLSLFPGRTVANLDVDKEAMTLEHLLTMASGLECRDSYLYRWRGIDQMRQTDDWVQYMLDLPMAEPPGSRFEYCNGASFLLSAITHETTGESAHAFAETHLFSPLGITGTIWPANSQGIAIGWGGLRLMPQDMAKIGYLYLNDGRWDGEQIVPADWIAASTQQYLPATLQDGYGYQWWISDDGVYMALGYAGQFIFVVPDRELIVAVTSNLNENDFYTPQHLLNTYIIPAAQSDAPLPANPDGLELLESRIRQVGLNQADPQPPPPLPETAQRVSGRTYRLEPNGLGYNSVSLTYPEEAEALLHWTRSPEDAGIYAADPTYRSQGEWPIGLDNLFRFSRGRYGIPEGLMGGWESNEVFGIDCDHIDNTGHCRIKLTFDDDQLTLQIWEDDQPLPEVRGVAE